jgi:hypothetical protein
MCFSRSVSAPAAPAPVPTYEETRRRTPKKPMAQRKPMSDVFTSSRGLSQENVIKRSLLGGNPGA